MCNCSYTSLRSAHRTDHSSSHTPQRLPHRASYVPIAVSSEDHVKHPRKGECVLNVAQGFTTHRESLSFALELSRPTAQILPAESIVKGAAISRWDTNIGWSSRIW